MANELEAINRLLVARGVTPIIDLNSGHPDVMEARLLLATHRANVQSLKWWYNTETATLYPNEYGNIMVTPDITALDNAGSNIIMNGKLYNTASRTNVYSEPVIGLTLIYNRSWEYIPRVAFEYIVCLAKEEFVRILESQPRSQQARADVQTSKSGLDIANYRAQDVSKETGNPLMTKWRSKMLTR